MALNLVELRRLVQADKEYVVVFDQVPDLLTLLATWGEALEHTKAHHCPTCLEGQPAELCPHEIARAAYKEAQGK